MSNLISRRNFLKLLALNAGTALLSACQKGLSLLSPTPPPTLSPTATEPPTPAVPATAAPTPITTSPIKPTLSPAFSAQSWADLSHKNLAQAMFPLTGGVNHQNRYAIDLLYGKRKIAYVAGAPISPDAALQFMCNEAAMALNRDEDLLSQLISIDAQFEPEADITIIVEGQQGNRISQIIKTGSSEVYDRYMIENGLIRLLSKEEEPPLLPDLFTDGPYLKRVDTNETVVFKGYSFYPYDNPGHGDLLNYVARNIEANQSLGLYSNILKLVIKTEDAMHRTGEIKEVIHYLQSKGFYLIINLDIHKTWPEGKECPGLPNEEVKIALDVLSQDLVGTTNILYQFWSEPEGKDKGVTWTTWNRSIDQFSEVLVDNYLNINNKPVILISGIQWARDIRDIRDHYALLHVADIHDYPLTNGFITTDSRRWWTGKIGKLPIVVSEIGDPRLMKNDHTNPCTPETYHPQSDVDIEYIKQTFEIINHPNNTGMLHYLIWRGEDSSDGTYYRGGGLTPRGEIAKWERETYPTQTDFTG
jgi:hypothetical protein